MRGGVVQAMPSNPSWKQSPMALTKRTANLLMKWGLPILLFLGWTFTEPNLNVHTTTMEWVALILIGPLRLHLVDFVVQTTPAAESARVISLVLKSNLDNCCDLQYILHGRCQTLWIFHSCTIITQVRMLCLIIFVINMGFGMSC